MLETHLGPDFVIVLSQMFLTVMPGFPLCISSGFDQIVPCLYCCVQDQNRAQHPLFEQVTRLWSLVYNGFTKGRVFSTWLEIY